MDGKGLAILVLLFLITMMLFAPQSSGFVAAPEGASPAAESKGVTGGMVGDIQGSETDGGMFAPFAAMASGVGFKIGQTPTDPNVGLIPGCHSVRSELPGPPCPDRLPRDGRRCSPQRQPPGALRAGQPPRVGEHLQSVDDPARHDAPQV